MAATAPKKIGKFTILQPLGSGASGSVYLGKDPNGVQVAIKKIMKPSLRQLLSNNEAKMMKQYSRHPNLVYLIEKIESYPTLNLVMNYVGSDNLLTYVNREGAFAETFARQIFEKMLAGIEHLHLAGVVHRDLKAENILLTPDISPVICDLGFAAQWSTKKFLTKSCGSLHYAAPEIIQGKNYTGPEIDVWSLGVVLYTIIAGHLPWSGSREELIDFISYGDYWLIDRFSSQLLELLDHMMEPSVLSRWTIEDIKGCVWFRSGEEPASDPIQLGTLNFLKPGNQQNLFASGRKSGRSLYSSHRSTATPSTIEPSPTIGVPEEEDTVPEIVVKHGEQVIDHEKHPPPDNRLLARSASSSNLSFTNEPEEQTMDISSVPNWSVDISELGRYGEQDITAPSKPGHGQQAPPKNWKSKIAIFKAFSKSKSLPQKQTTPITPQQAFAAGKKGSAPDLLTVSNGKPGGPKTGSKLKT